jgi:hypothetical protein
MRFLRDRHPLLQVYIHLIRKRQNRFPAIPILEDSIVLNPSNRVKLIVIVAVFLAAVTFLGTAAAQKASVPKTQDRLTLGEENVKQLLLLMDTDKNGMVSKQDYMKFMEAEFQRLDKSHQGQLNAKQLTQSNLSAARYVGK